LERDLILLERSGQGVPQRHGKVEDGDLRIARHVAACDDDENQE
jgi:hypothetical protein